MTFLSSELSNKYLEGKEQSPQARKFVIKEKKRYQRKKGFLELNLAKEDREEGHADFGFQLWENEWRGGRRKRAEIENKGVLE